MVNKLNNSLETDKIKYKNVTSLPENYVALLKICSENSVSTAKKWGEALITMKPMSGDNLKYHKSNEKSHR